jgi:hypothetical protein
MKCLKLSFGIEWVPMYFQQTTKKKALFGYWLAIDLAGIIGKGAAEQSQESVTAGSSSTMN